MIVYRSTKSGFLDDAFKRDIHDVVLEAFKTRTGHSVGPSEIAAWKESLMYMAKVLNDEDIPADSGVAIEFGIPQSGKRIDFIVSGQGPAKDANVIIVELKRWSSAKRTEKDAIVLARHGKGEQEVNHPSYQAWSYAALLRSFNEAVYDGGLALLPCAYLHNYGHDNNLTHSSYQIYVERAPLFLQGEAERDKLRKFIKRHVKYGDSGQAIYAIENGRIRPSKTLVDSLVGMLKGNEEFVLIDDQKIVYENALGAAKRASEKSKQVMIIEGGPGTGKSVVAVNLLVALSKLGQVCRYVSKNAAPRSVFESKLTGIRRKTEISNLFSGSGVFTDTEPNSFDVLIVDEAHRLNEKSGLYGNLGDNQIKEIIAASKCAIFFIDEDQRVTLKDVGRKMELSRWAKALSASIATGELTSQFRCNGSDGYLAWLDSVLDIRTTANDSFDAKEFDFRVVDSPIELHRLIVEKNQVRNRARMVAGYCWNWVSKRHPDMFDIEIPEFAFRARWNLTSDGSLWIIAPTSVEEIGCIHTCQGLEVDHIGVIVGPDLIVRNGKIITRPEHRARTDQSLKGFKKAAKAGVETSISPDQIIKNTYRTLMTRGMKGCFVYCTDRETGQYFKARLMRGTPNESAEVLPFKRLTRTSPARPSNAVPLLELKIAAGRFGDSYDDAKHKEWAVFPADFHPKLNKEMFVAQVFGESMNRSIPNGAWCLFRREVRGSRNGRVVIAQHQSIADPETGGSYTVKYYSSVKRPEEEGEWRHTRIVLSPDSHDPQFKEIVLESNEAEQLRIIGELVAVLA